MGALMSVVGGIEDKVVFERIEGLVHARSVRCYAGFVPHPFRNQRRPHPEDRVRVEVRVAFAEDVSDQRLVTWRGDHEMEVRGSPWMTAQCFEQLAYRP